MSPFSRSLRTVSPAAAGRAVVRLFTVDAGDKDLLLAQFDSFVRQIPLLYFILGASALIVAVSHFGKAPVLLTLVVPGALSAVCLFRGFKWWRRRDADVSFAAALRHVRLTQAMSGVLAVGFTAWGFALAQYGDAYDQAEVVFFLALTMVSCLFSLMHLRPAALLVTLIGVVPFCGWFALAGHRHFLPEAANLALVSASLFTVLIGYSRDFAALVASKRDLLIERRAAVRLGEENQRLANLDTLSGLPNRRAVMARLDGLAAQAEAPVSLIFIDLDGFKEVNDVYGHEMGDELIVHAAGLFSARLSQPAMIARLGGDEFAVLMWDADAPRRALDYAHAVLADLARPILIGDRPIEIGASLGLAEARLGQATPLELFRRADVAMYEAKTAGKNRVMTYVPQMDAARQKQTDLAEEIRLGLERGEFDIAYQPIVTAGDRALFAVEALLRWPRRPAGPLGPDAFIPVAETTGLIHALGLYVLRKAAADIGPLGDLRLCVNVSPAQFRDPDFERNVAAVLAETGFPAERLEVEITEGYLIEHPERASRAIAALKRMGVRVALDDYGTGHTSIVYLRTYAFDRIKIDKSLAGRVDHDPKCLTLVTGAIYIARGLDMEITAEGVETQTQETLLRLAGCHTMQGYLFSRPKYLEDLISEGLVPGAQGAARASR